MKAEDEIIRFADEFIFTKRQRYSFEKLRSDDIEIIFPEETPELLNLIKQSTPEAERIIHNLDLQIKKLGCPVNLKDTKIDEKNFWSNYIIRIGYLLRSNAQKFTKWRKNQENMLGGHLTSIDG